MKSRNIQRSFDFGPPKMRPQSSRFGKETLFFAILPDEEARRACVGLQRRLATAICGGGALRPAKLLHVSLRFVLRGERLAEETIFAALRAGGAVGCPCFTLFFDRVVTFDTGARKAVVATNGNGKGTIQELYRQLDCELTALGGKASKSALQPHLTLLYHRQAIPAFDLAQPLIIEVDKFHLIRSFEGQGRYDYLGAWPLTDADLGLPGVDKAG